MSATVSISQYVTIAQYVSHCSMRGSLFSIFFCLFFGIPLSIHADRLSDDEAVLPPPSPYVSYLPTGQVEEYMRRKVSEDYGISFLEEGADCKNQSIQLPKEKELFQGYSLSGVLPSRLPYPLSCELVSGRQALLNMQSHWWRGGGALKSSGQIKTWRQGIFHHDVQFEFDRAYPRVLKDFTREQLFRETFRVFVAERSRALSWLTFRLIGPEEDLLWAYSPALNQVRKITGVNREDLLVETSLSLDDLMYGSRKLDSLRVIGSEARHQLVPFVANQWLTAVKNSDNCTVLNSSQFRNQFRTTDAIAPHLLDADFVGQQPVASQFRYESLVPRPVLAITIESTNPYSSRARETIIVDRELFIPYYRMAYDILGRLSRMSYIVSGLAKNQETKEVFPVMKYAFIYDYESETASKISFHNFLHCPLKESYLNTFQPNALISKTTDKMPNKTQ